MDFFKKNGFSQKTPVSYNYDSFLESGNFLRDGEIDIPFSQIKYISKEYSKTSIVPTVSEY
jgi:hypothetical protein